MNETKNKKKKGNSLKRNNKKSQTNQTCSFLLTHGIHLNTVGLWELFVEPKIIIRIFQHNDLWISQPTDHGNRFLCCL
jgi:hypothetical protein